MNRLQKLLDLPIQLIPEHEIDATAKKPGIEIDLQELRLRLDGYITKFPENQHFCTTSRSGPTHTVLAGYYGSSDGHRGAFGIVVTAEVFNKPGQTPEECIKRLCDLASTILDYLSAGDAGDSDKWMDSHLA
jgi:hypothetical protein